MLLKYHDYSNHILPMLNSIDDLHINGIGSESKLKILRLACIFHDIVYRPMSKTNEEDSVKVFEDFCTQGMNISSENYLNFNNEVMGGRTYHYMEEYEGTITDEERSKVKELILNTKNPFDARYGDELGHYFYLLDTQILRNPFSDLIRYEEAIYQEYKPYVTLREYKQGRTEFLKKCIDNLSGTNNEGLERLISYVNNRDYGTLGIFAGSFNPFHTGHMNIVHQALDTFDDIVVVQLQSFDKSKNTYELPELEGIKTARRTMLLTDVIDEFKEGYRNVSVIRALRNGDDLQHEQNLKQLVHDFDDSVRFVYYLADVKYQHISSSMVRNLPNELRDKYIIQ